jgi:hypothetical protein
MPLYCWVNPNLSTIVMIRFDRLFLYNHGDWHEIEVDHPQSLITVAHALAEDLTLVPAVRAVAETLCGISSLEEGS